MAVTSNIHIGLSAWSSATYSVGNRRSSGGNAYEVTTAGSSTAAPTGTGSSINNGGVAVWKWLSAINYTTLQAWRDAWPGTITQDLVGLVWADSVITPSPGVQLFVSAAIDMAGFKATLQPAPGDAFRDRGSNLALAYDSTRGVAILLPASAGAFPVNYIEIDSPNFTFDRLQIKDPFTTSGSTILYCAPGAFNFRMSNCIIDGTAQAGGAVILDFGDTVTVVNTLVVDRQSANSNQITVRVQSAASAATFLNNTSVAINSQSTTAAIVSDATTVGGVIIRNHISCGYVGSISTSVGVSGGVVVDHSATDQTAIGDGSVTDGSGNLVSRAASALFVNVATDFRLKAGAPAIGVGAVDTTTNPAADDFFGTARGASWDIGADEYSDPLVSASATIAAAGTVAPKALLRATGKATVSGAIATATAATTLPGTSSANIAAIGSLTAPARVRALASAVIPVVGSVAPGVTARVFTNINRAVQLGVSINTILIVLGRATIAASGTIAVDATVVLHDPLLQATANIQGAATVAPPARVIALAQAAVAGTGSITVPALLRQRASAAIAAAATINVVATGGVANVVQALQAIAGQATVQITPRVLRKATVNPIAGAFTVFAGATRALPQSVTHMDPVTGFVVRAVARRLATARISGAVRVSLSESASNTQAVTVQVGQEVEVPTELEFDALAARVAALESAAPQLALYAAKAFYLVEISASRAPTSVLAPTKGYGTRPFGAVARRTGIVLSTTSILASDLGYRTKATDQVGVLSYPPLVSEAFQIDRRVNLDPAASAIGAAWGSISLSNAGRAWDGLAASWDNDGRDVRILSGIKAYDASRGYFTDPGYAELRNVFIGLTRQWILTDNSLDVPLIDAAYWLDRPYQTSTYGGGGRYDGTGDLAGSPLPRARGGVPSAPIPNVSPTLVDPINRIYQYSDAPGEILALREGGATPFGYGGDTTDLYTGTTASGFYRSDNSRAMFQLGAPAQGQITADVIGAFPLSGPVSSAADLIFLMMTEDMALPDTYVDIDSFSLRAPLPNIGKGFAVASRGALARRTIIGQTREPAAAPAGVYFSSQDRASGLQAVQAVLGSIGGQIIPTRLGVLRLVLLRALTPASRPVATYDPSILVSVTHNQLPAGLSPMPYRFRVAYAHNYTVQKTGVSVSATPEQTQFAASADRFATWISPGIQAALRRPSDPNPVGGALLLQGDAQAVANRLGDLWGIRRRSYTAVLPSSAGLLREIGDVVSIQYPLDDLSSGRLGTIVGEQFDSMSGLISHQLLV